LRRGKAGSFGSAFFCEFQIEINTIIIYKNHLLVGVTLKKKKIHIQLPKSKGGVRNGSAFFMQSEIKNGMRNGRVVASKFRH